MSSDWTCVVIMEQVQSELSCWDTEFLFSEEDVVLQFERIFGIFVYFAEFGVLCVLELQLFDYGGSRDDCRYCVCLECLI